MLAHQLDWARCLMLEYIAFTCTLRLHMLVNENAIPEGFEDPSYRAAPERNLLILETCSCQ